MIYTKRYSDFVQRREADREQAALRHAEAARRRDRALSILIRLQYQVRMLQKQTASTLRWLERGQQRQERLADAAMREVEQFLGGRHEPAATRDGSPEHV